MEELALHCYFNPESKRYVLATKEKKDYCIVGGNTSIDEIAATIQELRTPETYVYEIFNDHPYEGTRSLTNQEFDTLKARLKGVVAKVYPYSSLCLIRIPPPVRLPERTVPPVRTLTRAERKRLESERKLHQRGIREGPPVR